MLTVAAGKLDNINDAVDEIPGQPGLAVNLLKKPAGITACKPEFVHSGDPSFIPACLPRNIGVLNCPVKNAEGITVNHARNFTFIVCAF
jgi:hypothetical protein